LNKTSLAFGPEEEEMMKKLIALLILVAGGYFAYQHFKKGDVALLDQGPQTPAQAELKELEARFQQLKDRYETGEISSHADIESARNEADRLRADLKKLREDLTTNRDKTKVGQLMLEIKKFKDEIL
jgi:predicted negative regulator of RcsB-dependent stress response